MRSRWTSLLPLIWAATGLLTIPARLDAQDADSRFSLHGHLTQAYARADKDPTLGMTKNGTWDYRVLALQMRYALTDEGQFVVQVRHRHGGETLINDKDVALEWAYYMHDFGIVKVKIGKMPLALGLYNEFRNVGTLLPFYRVPAGMYFEGSDAVEGASLTNITPFGKWELESSGWVGGSTLPLQAYLPTGPVLNTLRSHNSYGASLWVRTPIPGLRAGVTFFSIRAQISTDTTRFNVYNNSLDATFENVQLRSEYGRYTIRNLFPGMDRNAAVYYVQGGVRVFGPLWVNAQFENTSYNDAGDKYVWMRDRVLGLKYNFGSDLAVKLEGHRQDGYNFDKFLVRPSPPGKTNYGIASLSVSF
jgi:hypothetical protein